MLAAVFQGPGKELLITQRPVPRIEKDDDVILKVGGVGVCGSDLSMLESFEKHPALPGVIFGHEFGGGDGGDKETYGAYAQQRGVAYYDE